MVVEAIDMDHWYPRNQVGRAAARRRGNGRRVMTRFRFGGYLDRAERRFADAPRMKRLMYLMQTITEDRILQGSAGVAGASLCLTLAFGDARFLVLLPAAIIAVQRFRLLERDFDPDDDDWL
jgi:hypothetical protein